MLLIWQHEWKSVPKVPTSGNGCAQPSLNRRRFNKPLTNYYVSTTRSKQVRDSRVRVGPERKPEFHGTQSRSASPLPPNIFLRRSNSLTDLLSNEGLHAVYQRIDIHRPPPMNFLGVAGIGLAYENAVVQLQRCIHPCVAVDPLRFRLNIDHLGAWMAEHGVEQAGPRWPDDE